LKIGHNESFEQKPDNYILVRPQSLSQKSYRVTNFSIFHDFLLSLITQRVFIAKTCAGVRWDGILLSKIQKNQQQQIFSKKKFDSNYSKLPMNNNYMMYDCSKPFVVPA
jgi:hypothetical protein